MIKLSICQGGNLTDVYTRWNSRFVKLITWQKRVHDKFSICQGRTMTNVCARFTFLLCQAGNLTQVCACSNSRSVQLAVWRKGVCMVKFSICQAGNLTHVCMIKFSIWWSNSRFVKLVIWQSWQPDKRMCMIKFSISQVCNLTNVCAWLKFSVCQVGHPILDLSSELTKVCIWSNLWFVKLATWQKYAYDRSLFLSSCQPDKRMRMIKFSMCQALGQKHAHDQILNSPSWCPDKVCTWLNFRFDKLAAWRRFAHFQIIDVSKWQPDKSMCIIELDLSSWQPEKSMCMIKFSICQVSNLTKVYTWSNSWSVKLAT